MLQKLNERIQGMIAWIVIGLVGIAFTLFGVESYLQAQHHEAVEAEVDGQSISKHEVELQFRRLRQQQESLGMTDADEHLFKQQILNDMLSTKVNTRAARRYGFEYDMAQTTHAIWQIPQFQKDGQFSTDRYQQTLSNAFYTPQAFQDEVRQGMLLNQQRFAFIGTAFALPDEINQFVKLYGQTRDYRYVLFPVSDFMHQVVISDQELKSYYQAHRQEFVSPETVQLEYVKLSMSALQTQFKPQQTDLKAYYEANQSNFLAPAKWQLRHVLFQTAENSTESDQAAILARAKDFRMKAEAAPSQFPLIAEGLVKEHSDMVQGVLPWVVAGESDIDEALLSLSKPGELLGPIKTHAGYEVYQLIAYEPSQSKPFEAVRDEVESQWIHAHVQAEYARLLEALTDQSYQTPESLEEIAQTLKLPLQLTEHFSRTGGTTPLTNNENIVKVAFSHDVLALGNNSAPIQLDEDTVIVLRVHEHHPSKQISFSQVKADIAKRLRQISAEQQAQQMGTRLLESISQRGFDEMLFSVKKYPWHEAHQATREFSKVPAEINRRAFALSDSNPWTGILLDDKSAYVLIQLKEVHDGQLNQFDSEQLVSIAEQIGANYGAIDYDLYVNQLLNQAKVVRYSSSV